MLKLPFCLPEKSRCLRIIVSWMLRISYWEFMQPFLYLMQWIWLFRRSKRDVRLSVYSSFALKVAKRIATSHMSLISQSSLQPLTTGCLTDSSHYLVFLFICPIYFCTTAVLATHENTWAVDGTVHVPWVIFNKSLTRHFDNSQIHASNAI